MELSEDSLEEAALEPSLADVQVRNASWKGRGGAVMRAAVGGISV